MLGSGVLDDWSETLAFSAEFFCSVSFLMSFRTKLKINFFGLLLTLHSLTLVSLTFQFRSHFPRLTRAFGIFVWLRLPRPGSMSSVRQVLAHCRHATPVLWQMHIGVLNFSKRSHRHWYSEVTIFHVILLFSSYHRDPFHWFLSTSEPNSLIDSPCCTTKFNVRGPGFVLITSFATSFKETLSLFSLSDMLSPLCIPLPGPSACLAGWDQNSTALSTKEGETLSFDSHTCI